MAHRILFAGGCHIDGYLVGERRSFVAESLDVLAGMGRRSDVQTLARLPLTQPERLAVVCGKYQPELLVLQLGNWETKVGLREHLRRRRGLASSRASLDTISLEAASLVFRPGFRWRAKTRVRQVLDLILGHTLVNTHHMEMLLDIFFDEVVALNIPDVLVLSPLPCLDPVHWFYRQRLLSVFEAASSRRGFLYLDVFDLYSRDPRAHAEDLFADPDHLNVAGHRWLGEIVGHRIHSLMVGKTTSLHGVTAGSGSYEPRRPTREQ